MRTFFSCGIAAAAILVLVGNSIFMSACSPSTKLVHDTLYVTRTPHYASQNTPLTLPNSVEVPSDGSAVRQGSIAGVKVTRAVTFKDIGQRVEVKTGETVSLVYDGIDAETTYLRYESIEGGYALELAKRNEVAMLSFRNLCQIFIVDNPANCVISLLDDLRYEQVIWTPRADGMWEVRVGSVNRRCRSEALDQLEGLRSSEYERNLPRYGK